MSWLFAAFLIAHGLVHAAIWLAPASDDVPFDVRHSWLLGELGSSALVVALVAAAVFVVAGVGFLAGAPWWPGVLLAASVISLALLVVTFTPWWLFGVGINVALAAVALRELWA